MKLKWLYIALVVFIFGGLIGLGFLFKTYETKLIWIIEGIALSGILLSVVIYRQLIKPYEMLLSGMELLKDQDFSTTLRLVKNREANQVIGIFNRMINQLRSERLQIREKNRFLDLLINASPQGILVMDYDFRITDINPAGLRLLHIRRLSDVQGKTFSELNHPLAPALSSLEPEEDRVIRGESLSIYRCVRSSFSDQGFNHPFILIEELTRELLEVEKASYERIIRMMSHEVNNSVGAIGSTLNVVSDICSLSDAEEWQEVLPAVDASLNRCDHLAQFISKLAEVVRIPPPSFSYLSLNELAKSVDSLTRIECNRRDIRLTLCLSPEENIVRADGIQLEQVLVNLIKNAYEAIGEHGEIRITTSSTPATILIEDDGPGVPTEVKDKLFTPFFTTKPAGQGIGLMFVRDVLINHECRFGLSNEEGWTRFRISFPPFSSL